jgi:hypothetical protein
MSSHHFVKEGQEPALFILEPMGFEDVAPLLEWVPLIMVNETVLDEVLKWGIKIDVILQGETELEQLEKKVADQLPLQVLSYKNNDALNIGIQFLIRKMITSVNVICRTTEEVFEKMVEFSPHIQIGLFGDKKWFYVRAGKFEKWMPAGHKLLLRPHGKPFIQTNGIIQTDNEWKVVKSGMVLIHCEGPFWVGEALNDAR